MLLALIYWSVGLAVAILGGRVAAPLVVRWVRGKWPGRWAWKVGVIESAFFATLIGIGIQGVAPAMVLWISAKMAAGWNSRASSDDDTIKRARFGALAGGLASMGFAAIGDVICAMAQA